MRKIRTDTICVEIVNQLRGQVSDRFIRECLDEKYKQKVRVENARKQQSKKDKETDKLAAVTPLNQEEVEDKKVVIVDASGRTSIQENEDKEPPTTTDSSKRDKSFTPVSYQQEQQSKNQAKHCLEETSDENRKLKETPEKASPLIAADKMVSVVSENKMIQMRLMIFYSLNFLCLPRICANRMALRHPKIGDDGKVWFNGKIDKKTGEVTYSNVGRIDQQQD